MKKMTEQTLKDRKFQMGSDSRMKSFIENQTEQVKQSVSLMSYLSDIRNSLTSFIGKTINVRVANFSELSDALKNVTSQLTSLKQDPPQLKISVEREDTDKVIAALESVKKQVASIDIPEHQKTDLAPVVKSLEAVRKQISVIPKPKEVNLPKVEKVIFPSKMSMLESKDIITELKSVEKAIRGLPGNTKQTDNKPILKALAGLEKAIEAIVIPEPKAFEFPEHFSVDNFPPVLTPQPVTHMSINSINGFIHTTSTTVSTTLTKLPGYGELDSRRSLICFNNSSTITIFLGGSDITSANGLPVPPKTYSPPLDAGKDTILYGVTSSGSADVRIMEVSDERSGR